jgi:hypothetical protein
MNKSKDIRWLLFGLPAVAVFACLIAIAIPHKARTLPPTNPCINRLRQIDGAKEQWALENHAKSGDIVTIKDISSYIYKASEVLKCPQGGSYTIGRIGENPKCSVPGHSL